MIRTTLSFFRIVKERLEKINPLFLALILFLIFLTLPLATYNYPPVSGDIAEYLNNPLRIMNGDLPYKDFWLIFPPGEVFLPFFIYKVFGLNINILLAFSVVISAFCGLFSFLVGKSIFRDNFFAMVLATLVFFNGIPAHHSGYTYIQMYFLLLLISTLFFTRYLKNEGVTELFLTGIFAGLAFLFRFYLVGSASLAMFIIILIQSKFDQKSLNHTVKSLGVFLSGIFIVWGTISFALIEIWQPMIKEIVIESVSTGISMNLPYFIDLTGALGSGFTSLEKAIESSISIFTVKFIYHSGRTAGFLVMHILPFLLTGVSAYYLIGGDLKKSEKILVLFFLLWGLFAFPKALGRSGLSHLTHSITPLFFLLIFLLQKSIKFGDKSKTPFDKFTAYGFVAITLLLLTSVPLFLANTGCSLMKTQFEVSTQYGTLLLNNESEANSVNAVLKSINKNTEEGDYIFVTPWYAPPFYALTNRKNPTYYDSIVDVISRPSDEKQERICNDLLNKDTKLIIHYADWGFDDKEELQFLNTCPILHKCIEDNFELVEKYGHYWIYIKKI